MIYLVKTSKKVVKAFGTLGESKSYVSTHSGRSYSIQSLDF